MNARKHAFTTACLRLARQAASEGLTSKEALDVLAQMLCQIAAFYGVSRASLLENVGVFFDRELGLRSKLKN